MFLNNLVFISVPILGLVFTVMMMFNRTFRRQNQHQIHRDKLSSRSITIPVNSTNDPRTFRFSTTFSNENFDDDDDEDLIQSDPSSISALNFCANDDIELRLNNDIDDLDMQQV